MHTRGAQHFLPCPRTDDRLCSGHHVCALRVFASWKQRREFLPSLSPPVITFSGEAVNAVFLLLARSFHFFIGTVLSPETIADCFWCAQKDLVLAGRLSVNKLNILCKKRACALFQPDFQVSFVKTIILITTCKGVRNLHKTETRNTLKRVWGRSKEREDAPMSRGRRLLLESLDQNPPDLRLSSYYPIRKSPCFPHTSDLVNSLKTAILSNLNSSNHRRWGAFLAGRERI